MPTLFTFIIFAIIAATDLFAQGTYFPSDSLSNNDIILYEINEKHTNTYIFNSTIDQDSVFLVIPPELPLGYFEAYYYNDTNRIALLYYNNGVHSYCQQFYADGSMKSDSEYNKFGDLHGLHVIFDRKGEEVWHAEYYFGELEREYNYEFLEIENATILLLKNKQAFGTYTFTPTPSRARRDKIILRENKSFTYRNTKNNCHYCNSYEGKWVNSGNYIILTPDKSDIWRTPDRKFAITASPQLTNLKLIEVKDWGVEWYNSEYRKTKKNVSLSKIK